MRGLTREWPGDRHPPPPAAFDPWRELGPVEGDLVERLVEAGLKELDRAVSRPGRDREAAFLLLEADGYLTYACEAAAETPEAEEAMLRILEGIGSRAR